jgi:hypothetical protein
VSEVIEVIEYKSWVCLICGWIYNEEEGGRLALPAVRCGQGGVCGSGILSELD